MDNTVFPAIKMRLGDITVQKTREKGESDLGYVVDKFGRKLSRINIVATILDKFVSPDGNYMSLTVDDGSGVIRIKLFGEDVRRHSSLELGDEIAVVGRLRRYNDEIYLAPESVDIVDDMNFGLLRRMESLLDAIRSKRAVDSIKTMAENDGLEAAKRYASENFGICADNIDGLLKSGDDKKISAEELVIKVITDMDEGDGVELGVLLKKSRLSENQIDAIMTKLLDDGTIFEPHVGRFKIIG